MIDTQTIRGKILDLAIQGLLTDRGPDDGSGKELVSHIVECKATGRHGDKKTPNPA